MDPARSERQTEPTYDEGLWRITCDQGHEWVGGPDTEEYVACPVCAQDEGCEGMYEVPDGTPIGVDSDG